MTYTKTRANANTPNIIVSVLDFGAKGDGSNDTDAINDALDWWSSAAGRHLHFPEGSYLYNGNKVVDFVTQNREVDENGNETLPEIRKHGNKLTMDGYIIAGTDDVKQFTIRRLSDGYVQMFVWGGGAEGNFMLTDPPTGSTFLQVEAAHNTKFNIRSINYAGRVLRMTHLNGPHKDDTYGGNRCVFNDTYVTGKGRVEGRVGQQFFCDSGTNANIGAFGMITWIGDGYIYGSVLERLNDVTVPFVEAGSFDETKEGAALEFRNLANVHCGDIYLGEIWGISSNGIPLGQPGKQYQDCMQTDNTPDYKKVLFNITGDTGFGRSRNIFINKYNALLGGVGLNIEETFSLDSGIIINQMNSGGCGVGLNLNDIDGDIYIGSLAGQENGMLINKYGATNTQTPLIDINVVKMGKILFNGQNKKENGDPQENDPIMPAIRSFYHHGLFKITGNFEDKTVDVETENGWILGGLKEDQPIIEIIDNGDEYYLINNARFNTANGDGISATGTKAIYIDNDVSNNVRVTDCIFVPSTAAFGANTPSYVRGCVGATDT